MGIVVVEVCDINPICFLDIESLELEYPGVSVIKTSCLSYCSICAKSPYAMVNGEIVIGDTAEEVMRLVRERIEQELQEFDH
jgi:uncharacterized protein YuzB (UPF0349 family)